MEYLILLCAIFLTFASLAAAINMGIRLEAKESPLQKAEVSSIFGVFTLCSVSWVLFFAIILN